MLSRHRNPWTRLSKILTCDTHWNALLKLTVSPAIGSCIRFVAIKNHQKHFGAFFQLCPDVLCPLWHFQSRESVGRQSWLHLCAYYWKSCLTDKSSGMQYQTMKNLLNITRILHNNLSQYKKHGVKKDQCTQRVFHSAARWNHCISSRRQPNIAFLSCSCH